MAIDPDKLYSTRETGELDGGVSNTTVFKRLLLGQYTAYKDGARTFITGESILRRRKNLPKAQFGLRRGVKGVPPQVKVPAP